MTYEVLDYLDAAPGKDIVDCTVGGGGHARAILERIAPYGRLIGIDADEEALGIARSNLEDFKDRVRLIHGNFRDIDSILSKQDLGVVDGVIYDLGISSFQLEKEERGFSIKLDGPLDMRMDGGLRLNAGYLVNKLRRDELADILRSFGEERYAGRIAKAIVANRPTVTTRRLAEIVSRAVPVGYRHGRIHPATRTFQALRIAVNGELEALSSSLDKVFDHLKTGGRICVISFHSLEDRIVKNRFRDQAKKNIVKIITKKPLVPKAEEVLSNPRSRSAKLRVAERL